MADACKTGTIIKFLVALTVLAITGCTGFVPTRSAKGDAVNAGAEAHVNDKRPAGGNPASTHPMQHIVLTDLLFANDSATLASLTQPSGETYRLENMEVLGTSNYQSILQHRAIVEEVFVPFDDDSVALSASERGEISRLVARSAPTAWYRIVANSHGPTRLSNGNEVLAERRAVRVMQQLVAAGVPPSHILPEGCWSRDPAKADHPDRGAFVITYRQP